MIKTILSTLTVATLVAFSGCSALTDNPLSNAVKSTAGAVADGAKSTTGAVVDGAKGAASTTTGVVSDVADVATGKTSLKDKATDMAVEAADSKTDGKASQVLDAVNN